MAVLAYFYIFNTIVLILHLPLFVLLRSQCFLRALFLTSTTAQPSSPVRRNTINCVAGKRRTVGLMSTEAPSPYCRVLSGPKYMDSKFISIGN